MKDRDYSVLGAKLNKDPVELETIFQYQVSKIDAHGANHLGLNRFTVKELKLIKKHFLPYNSSGILRLSGRKDESIQMLTRYFTATKALQPLQCEYCAKKAQVGQKRCQQHENMPVKPKNRAALKPSSSQRAKASQNVRPAKRQQLKPARQHSAVKRKRVSGTNNAAAVCSQPPFIPTNRYMPAEMARLATQAQFGAQARAQAHPRTQPRPQPRTQSRPQPRTQSRPQPRTQSRPQPRTQPRPQPRTQSLPQPRTQSRPQPRTQAQTPARTQAQSVSYPRSSSSSHAFEGFSAAPPRGRSHHASVQPPTIEPLPADFDRYYPAVEAKQTWHGDNTGGRTNPPPRAAPQGQGNGMRNPYSNAPFIPYHPFPNGYAYAASSTGQPGYPASSQTLHQQRRVGGQHGGPQPVTGHTTQGLSMEDIDDMEDRMIQNVLALSKEENARQRQAQGVAFTMNPLGGYQGANSQGYHTGVQIGSHLPQGATAAFHEPRSDSETKSEPLGWDELLPLRGNEAHDIKRFAKYGFSKVKVLQTLRKYGNNLQQTSLKLFQDFTDLQEAKQVDQAALLSERSGEEEAAKQKQQEKVRLEFGDVLATGEFTGSVLLSTIVPRGFRDLLETEKSTDGSIVIDLEDEDASACRTSCIKLLVLEKRAFKWFKNEAKDLFAAVAKKFNDRVAQGKAVDEGFIQKVLQETEEALFRFPSADGLKYAGKPIQTISTLEDGIEIISSEPKATDVIEIND